MAAAPEPAQTPPVPLPVQASSSSSRKRAHPEPFAPKTSGSAPKRRRGRPSKADIAARDSQTGAATFQPRMYTPAGQGRGGAGAGAGPGGLLFAAPPASSSHGQAGSLQQQLANRPQKKRGRPSKAEIEARERARLEALHMVQGMGIHAAGDLPLVADPEQQPPRQKGVHDPRQEHDTEHEPEQGQGPDDGDDDDDSDDGAADSPEDDD